MKTKLLSIVLALVCLVQPVMAIGMVGVESADEIVTITANEEAKTAEVMSEQPSNVLFYEDFESSELTSIKGFTPSYTKEGITASFARNHNGSAYANWNIIDENGDKVLHINQANGANNNTGYTLSGLDISQPGVYTLSYQFKQVLGDNATGVDALWGGSGSSTWYQGTFNSLQIPAIPTKYATENLGKWYDVQYQFVITDNGDGTRNMVAKNSLNSWVGSALKLTSGQSLKKFQNYHFFQPNNAATVGNLYLDNVKLTYGQHVTLKYVDSTGAVLGSVTNTYQGAKITLPTKASLGLAYTPVFKIGNVNYEGGASVEVPVDAGAEYTVAVTEKTFPATAPKNAVLFEDFENRTIGAAAASVFNYSAKEYEATKITTGVAGYAALRTDVYAYAPDNAANKTFKVENAKSRYAPGFQITNLNLANPGKYKIQYKLYTDAAADKHPTIYYYARINGSNELIRWEYPTISSSQRGKWINVSYDLEVYEEDGVKKLKYDTDKVMECPASFNISFYAEATAASASNTINVWFDDVAITYSGSKHVIFMDEEGLPFEYQGKADIGGTTYKLPTADDMGISYDVEFVGEDGKTYFPGTSYTLDTSKDEYTFFVKKSDTVFYESFDKKSAGGDQATEFRKAPLAGSFTNPGTVSAADANGNKTAVWTNGGTYTEKNFWCYTGLKFTTPGIYKFSIDANLVITGTKTDADTSMKINMKEAHQYGALCNDLTITEGIPATLEGNIKVYEKSDGTLGYNTLNTTGNASSLASVMIGVKFNSIKNSTATYTVYFDNAKIEYSPYNPVNTMKTSYREENSDEGGPEGIRFAAYVNNDQRQFASEYGFVVTRKSFLGGDYTKLNLKGIDNISSITTTAGKNSDGITVVATAAYKEANSVDRIYVHNGEIFGLQGLYDVFYTAVLYGMDSDAKKAEVYVARPFAKVDGVYYYGECHEDSYDSVKARAEAAN